MAVPRASLSRGALNDRPFDLAAKPTFPTRLCSLRSLSLARCTVGVIILVCCRDDSTPGAIRLPVATEKSKQDVEESQMKRYLQCSGMCRIEVLKKFVRNKYSVDTSKFYVSPPHNLLQY